MKVLIVFNHFQVQDGVARTAIGMANALAAKDVQVVLKPLFKFDRSMTERLDPRVRIRPVFRCYFRGFPRLIGLAPKKLLNRWIVDDLFDIEVGLCMTLPIQIIAAYPDRKGGHEAIRFAWMHGYDIGLSLCREYERIGKVICVSKFNYEKLKENALGQFETDYAYNLVDDSAIREKGKGAARIRRTDGIQFVSVGRMSPEKGYMRLLDICKKLVIQGYHFSLWLIGDGPQRRELENYGRGLNLEGVVRFLGAQSNPHAYTAKADVFICSSFDEGYSTACTEAIMLGIPVLTTPVSGGKEIIEEAEAGLLVGMEDEELYYGLKTILDHPGYVEEWKGKLLETRERFSYKNRAQKLFDIFGI